MPGCPIQLTVRYADGKPAAFASVTVFESTRFLGFIPINKFVAAKTANFEGIVKFDLDKGKTYHVVFRAGSKKGDDIIKMDYCNRQRSEMFP